MDSPKQIFNCPTPHVYGSYFVLLRHQFCAGSAVVLCWSTAVVLCSLARQQFYVGSAAVLYWLGSSFLILRHLVFAPLAAAFWWFGSSSWLAGQQFLLFWQPFSAAAWAVVFRCLVSSFQFFVVVLNCSTHTESKFSTAYLPNSTAVVFCWFNSSFLLVRQQFLADSAAGFCSFDSSILPRQQFFALSAAVFCCFGSCFLLFRQSFFDFSACSFWLTWHLFFPFLAAVLCCFGNCLCYPTLMVGLFRTV